jgi:NTP pyrophosphatase (non-canonical NTP hydrolase)
MKLNEYQALALRTCPEGLDLRERMLMTTLGIGSEAGEVIADADAYAYGLPLNRDNVIKELGDICWYIAVMLDTITRTMSDIDVMRKWEVERRDEAFIARALQIGKHAGSIVEYVKQGFYHGHDLDNPALALKLAQLYGSVQDCANQLGASIGYVLERNIEKLRKRYPEGFSADASRNRVTERE